MRTKALLGLLITIVGLGVLQAAQSANRLEDLPVTFEVKGDSIVFVYRNKPAGKPIPLYLANSKFDSGGKMCNLLVNRDQSFSIVPGHADKSPARDSEPAMEFTASTGYLHIEYKERAVSIPWQLIENARDNAVITKFDGWK